MRLWCLYSCRHTFAKDMLDRTGNVKLVGDLLGHASLATTARYVHPSLKLVAAIINQRNVTRQEEVAAQCHIPRHSGLFQSILRRFFCSAVAEYDCFPAPSPSSSF
jgi:Phage integrase family